MDQTVKRSELMQWLGGVFQEPPEALGDARTRESIPTWDSMGSLMLIAELDERLHVVLEEHEIKSIVTLGDLLALLRGKRITIEG